MIREKLNLFINHEKTEKFIISLILINIIFFILATVDEIYFVSNEMFFYVDCVCTIIFTAELIIRIVICRSLKELLSPMLLIDLIAILPFYIGEIYGGSAIFLRIIRITRLLRIAKLVRYSSALKNITQAFKQKKEELVITLSFFSICVLVCGILMYLFEHSAQPDTFSSIPRSCYFAIVTFTTVGYGDFSPVTEEGRTVAAMMAILGTGIHGLLIGVIGTAISHALKVDD